MGKLGKKARKFAKKNLQSVLKRKRKLKSMFKKKDSSRHQEVNVEDQSDDARKLSYGTNAKAERNKNLSLDAIFSEDETDMPGNDSESDGYISEDLNPVNVVENESEDNPECGNDIINSNELSAQNREIHSELAEKIKRLNRLKEKNPGFLKFLEINDKTVEHASYEDAYSDDETSNIGLKADDQSSSFDEGLLLSNSVVDSLCHQVKETHNLSGLTSLINGYRAACHYGSESNDTVDAVRCKGNQSSVTFSKIIIFMLREADNLFRGHLGLSSSNCRMEMILELKNTEKWKSLKPLIKSYLRSSLFLLNQVSEMEILSFSLARIRASIIFFAAFPSLQCKLIKIAVHLWATGEGTVSSLSFSVIKDLSSVLGSVCFNTCWIKMYKAFIANCQFVEPILYKHIQFLKDSFVELCSLDVHRSTAKARVSIQQLANILHQGLQTKNKEAVKMIGSWQYTSCIDLWVKFISVNFHDYDLQAPLYNLIQIINGVTVLFPGPRYLPLRIKCIQWLNILSSSSGIFIPVGSLVLDILEYTTGKEGRNHGTDFNILCVLQLPKFWLKSQNFVEECVLYSIELLSVHFAQWSYNISFPELATIPLIQLKKFHASTTIENLKRVVKRFIDQVEQNIDFVQKQRNDVSFSPKDQQAVESFLQLEKCNSQVPFMQYYKSIIEKAASRNLTLDKKFSGANENKRKRRQPSTGPVEPAANGKVHSEKKRAKKRKA